MFTHATYACPVRVTSETFSSAIFIDREEIWNISLSDWLNSCSYACAYSPSVHTSIFLCLRLWLSHKCEPGFSTRSVIYCNGSKVGNFIARTGYETNSSLTTPPPSTPHTPPNVCSLLPLLNLPMILSSDQSVGGTGCGFLLQI